MRSLERDFRVLDAGCGIGFTAAFPENAFVVGIDISEQALARNQKLDERIVGDIQTDRLPENSFDLVVCHNVLEHLEAPALALRNLASALKPGGELDVQMPILWSAKGLLTKLTPHRFHVWCYRVVFRYADAGKEGHGPFRTHLAITPKRLERELDGLGLERVSSHSWRAELKLPHALRILWTVIGAFERVVLPARGCTEYHARFRKSAVESS